MEHQDETRQVAGAYDRAVRGHDGYGAGRFTIASGRGSVKTTHNHCAGIACPTIADLRRDLRVFQREGAGRDIALLEDLLGDLGYDVRPAARVLPSASPVALALHVPAAAGEVAAGLAEALRDGQVDGHEASALAPAVRTLRHRVNDLDAALRSIPSPQLGLEGAR